MDLPTLHNTPRQMTLAGKTFTVSALKQREWAEVQRWIKENSPSPLSVLKSDDLDGLTISDKKELLAQAIKEAVYWPPAVGTPEWWRALMKDGGEAKMFHVVLSKHQPITEEEATDLAETCSPQEGLDLSRLALGYEDLVPKASEG